MKKLILLILTAITVSAKAQTSVYHPFPTTNANWVYQYYDDFHNPTSYFGSYAITGDTVILGINYKKISGCPGWGFVCESGSIREDNKIIYYWPDTASTEYILYNFNLNVGDTLLHPYGGAVCANDTAIVWQVDSVLASDGYHRQLWFNSFAYWIEGVGALNYLLNPCNVLCVSGNDFLVCMATDSGFTYPAGIGSCIVSVPENLNANNKSFISPNPFTSEISITLQNQSPNIGKNQATISIKNILGQTVFTFSKVWNFGKGCCDLDLSFLEKGIYLVEVNAGGERIVRKVVKE